MLSGRPDVGMTNATKRFFFFSHASLRSNTNMATWCQSRTRPNFCGNSWTKFHILKWYSPRFFHGGSPKIVSFVSTSFLQLRKQSHLVAHGDYFSTANRRTKIPSIFRAIFGIFLVF